MKNGDDALEHETVRRVTHRADESALAWQDLGFVALELPARETNFTLTDVYNAEEAFVTGTFAGLVPVTEVDGRSIGSGERPVIARLQAAYRERVSDYVAGPGAAHPRP